MSLSRFKFRGSATLRKDANTTISAVVILQHFHIESRSVEAFYRIRQRIIDSEEVGPFAYAEELDRMTGEPNHIVFADSVRLIVLENPYARVPLSPKLFRGPLDQRWGVEDSAGWYTQLSMGSELEQLRTGERPVPFLLI